MSTFDENPSPLSREDALKIIGAVNERAVLVGGQAVAWWAQYYAEQGRLPSLAEPDALYVSRDADFLPNSTSRDPLRALVRDVANRLGGSSSTKFPFSSLVIGTVTYTDSRGQTRDVEFLKNVLGTGKRDKVLNTAVRFDAVDGPAVYVMHPVSLMESRVANVVELEKYRTPTGTLQARTAVAVLREWLNDKLDESWGAARSNLESVLNSRRAGLESLRSLSTTSSRSQQSPCTIPICPRPSPTDATADARTRPSKLSRQPEPLRRAELRNDGRSDRVGPIHFLERGLAFCNRLPIPLPRSFLAGEDLSVGICELLVHSATEE